MRYLVTFSKPILKLSIFYDALKRGLQPTQRTQRKKRNEMMSLLDRTITAASDDGECHWHAAKLWQTHAIKYEIIEIEFDLCHKLHNKLKTY